jgi:D-alanyl-lipoteichoic acid acyltransferase DltB (MBOAT superfamily)
MLFNSHEFILIFLPLALAAHFLAARRSTVAAALTTTLTSLIFYAWWKPAFVILPISSILLNYWLARKIVDANAGRRIGLALVGVAANLLVLGYFKYFDFLVSIVEQRPPVMPDVPLALSFTTFVQIAFLLELSRKPEKIPLTKYAMFVSFFPHLIAGPIVRWSELGHQLEDRARYRVNWDNLARGVTIFCFGLGKKILIADPLAPFVSRVFDAVAIGQPVTAVGAWGASIAYSLQLYFDFSGYSDMAVGLALLFNLHLPINFAAPLRATSIIDLWRRWHISLSRFLRDFVYVSLGGGRAGPVRRAFNLFATMVVGGLWHGANWTFVVWGGFHGTLLIVNHAWRSVRPATRPTLRSRCFGWLLTFLAFAVGMTFFRAANLQVALGMLQAMAGFGVPGADIGFDPSFDFSLLRSGYLSEHFARVVFGGQWSFAASLSTAGALAVALLAPDTMELMNYHEGEPHSDWRGRGFINWRPNAAWLATTLILFALVFARFSQFTEFLYYQF